eukprot:TRINITY_DN3848_c0_g1_i1.p1 TRINITY_DN3848_c0_g1~~TRINITY_DN3848_c0_g1_i1.p1  ORF type:complete len:1039 (+),score=354.11 TRINITY_DN3848_c0_g1_i1:58-3117(+)
MLVCKLHLYLVFITLLACATTGTWQETILSAVTNLDRLQASNGGFKSSFEATEPSLEATKDALSVYSVFGSLSKINQSSATAFIRSLATPDGGYSSRIGAAADLESVSNAVLAYHYLGVEVPNSGRLAQFVQQQFDSGRTQLFVSGPGTARAGELRASVHALETLELLNSLQHQQQQAQRSFVKSVSSVLRDWLQPLLLPESGRFALPPDAVPTDMTPLGAQCYAVWLAKLVGIQTSTDIDARIARYIETTFGTDQGGYRSVGRGSGTAGQQQQPGPSVRATLQAMRTLSQLGHAPPHPDRVVAFVEAASVESVADLAAAVGAATLARPFYGLDIQLAFETLQGTGSVGCDGQLAQGARLKPVVSVSGGPFGGARSHHAAVEIDAEASASGIEWRAKLHWADDQQAYTAAEFVDTERALGRLVWRVRLAQYVEQLGELGRTLHASHTIGYTLHVSPDASLSGTPIQPGAVVGPGTRFAFGVGIVQHVPADEPLTVRLAVLDSGSVVLHEQHAVAFSSGQQLEFAYELSSAVGVPPGLLSFSFEAVSGRHGAVGQTRLGYLLGGQLVAVGLHWLVADHQQRRTQQQQGSSAARVGVGWRVELRMTPALLLSEAHSVQPLAPGHRQFRLDIAAASSGVVLHSVQGRPLDGPAATSADTVGGVAYAFAWTVDAGLDWVGTLPLTLRYVPADPDQSAASLVLLPFDASSSRQQQQQLGDDATAAPHHHQHHQQQQVELTVDAELRVSRLQPPPAADQFVYGSSHLFRFALEDVMSGQRVGPGSGHAHVVLELSQASQQPRGRTGLSHSYQEAEPTADGSWQVEWTVGANAVAGPGMLRLAIIDSDGTTRPLLLHGADKQRVEFPVLVGGKIDADPTTRVLASADAQHTTFVLDFALSSAGRILKDAAVRCSIYSSAGVLLASLLPATSDGRGSYALAWGPVPNLHAPAGRDTFKCFRDVDRQRTPSSADGSEAAAAALFEASLGHRDASESSLLALRPAEFIAVLAMVGAYFYLTKFKSRSGY